MANAVVRLDQIEGAIPVSIMYYSSGSPADVPNGAFVVIDGLIEGEREIFKATAPETANDPTVGIGTGKLLMVASPEFLPIPGQNNLSEFINQAGEAARAYVLHTGNIVSITAEAFTDVPDSTKKDIQLSGNGKYTLQGIATATNNKIGEYVDTQVVGGQTYYAFRICE